MIRAAKALINDNQKILLLKRSADSKFFPKVWDFPGGKFEDEDSPIEVVVRETLEETGLVITPGEILGEYDYQDTNVHYYFLGDFRK